MFHFEVMWAGDTECQKIIKQSWETSQTENSMASIMKGTKNCSKYLEAWNNVDSRMSNGNYERPKPHFNKSRKVTPVIKVEKEFMQLMEANTWLEREEILWHQQSRALWLQ